VSLGSTLMTSNSSILSSDPYWNRLLATSICHAVLEGWFVAP